LLFGGVYSNLQAIQAIAEIASKENIEPENCISITYCWLLCTTRRNSSLKNWQKKSIAGNVEIQLNEKCKDDCGCDFTCFLMRQFFLNFCILILKVN
jgi:hypothetical protein